MKIKRCIVLSLALCLFLFGCSSTIKETNLSFYYCKSETSYGFNAATVTVETRKERINPLDYAQIITTYLNGPKTDYLRTPFPQGTELVSINVDQGVCNITLTVHLSELTGIELTVACACLAKTASGVTGCAKVQISAQGAMLDNHASITMDANELLLSDALQ